MSNLLNQQYKQFHEVDEWTSFQKNSFYTGNVKFNIRIFADNQQLQFL